MDDFSISVDLSDFEREIEAAIRQQPEKVKAAMAEAAFWLWTVSKNWLTRLIYQRQIPLLRPRGVRGKMGQKARARAGGRLAWTRSYDLRNAERMAVSSDGMTASIFTDPDSKPAQTIKNWPGGYAQLQHERKKNPAKWRDRAREEGERGAVERFRKAFS